MATLNILLWCVQIQGLEQAGGSLVGGAISMLRNKPKGPKPERDPRLPEKPKGQTVGSFDGGLQALPDGMAKRLSKYIRSVLQPCSSVHAGISGTRVPKPGPAICFICTVRL